MMSRVLFLAALVVLLGSTLSAQTTPSNQSIPPSPGAAPAAQDAAKPQNQMPPETKAPAPIQNAKSPADSNSQAGILQPTVSGSLPKGTDIRATLDTPLSNKTAKPGDRFTATISAPVHDASGNVLVPIGSKLNGQVIEPSDGKLASAIKEMGHLNLRFTDIQLANGTDIAISATLLSVHNLRGRPFGATAHSNQTGNGPIGANAGSAGAFGPPLKGLSVGNNTDGGYVLSPTRKQVDLPAECGLRLRLDRDTQIP